MPILKDERYETPPPRPPVKSCPWMTTLALAAMGMIAVLLVWPRR